MRLSRKEWPHPQLSVGIWHGAGATRSWLHSPSWSKSFGQINRISTQNKFSIQMIRETLRDVSQTRIGNSTKWIPMREKVWRHDMLNMSCSSFVIQLSFSCQFSLISHQPSVKYLHFSISLCDDWLRLLLIRRSRLKNSCLKYQSPAQS